MRPCSYRAASTSRPYLAGSAMRVSASHWICTPTPRGRTTRRRPRLWAISWRERRGKMRNQQHEKSFNPPAGTGQRACRALLRWRHCGNGPDIRWALRGFEHAMHHQHGAQVLRRTGARSSRIHRRLRVGSLRGLAQPGHPPSPEKRRTPVRLYGKRS